jgi:putative transposase
VRPKVAAELGIRPPLLYRWAFWSSFKYELVYRRRFATHAEARTAVFDYIETFYNRTRLHSSLAYLRPH